MIYVTEREISAIQRRCRSRGLILTESEIAFVLEATNMSLKDREHYGITVLK